MTQLVVINNEDPRLCGPCGGDCCKVMPGIASPDLLPDLVEALRSGRWAIDWYGDRPEETLYIRPAIKGVTTLFDPSYGGECINLTGFGCSLEFDQRPIGCRELKPIANSCRPSRSKGDYAALWASRQEAIREAAKIVRPDEVQPPEPEEDHCA